MKRIRIIGLAAIMALALAAVGASTASASFFSYTKYEALPLPKAEQVTHLIFSGGRDFYCEGETDFPVEQYSAASETLTTNAEYSGCKALFIGAGTFTMNGCKWIHRPGAETSPGVFAGTLEVGPAGCTPMVITWPEFHCKFTVGAQSAATGSTYTNGTTSGKPSVTIKDDVSLKATRIEGTVANCSSELQTFSFTAKTLVRAESGFGITGVRVTPRPAVGLYMSGKESAEPALQPKLEAESYPVNISGAQDSAAKHVITVAGGRKFECGSVSSTGELGSSTTSLSLNSTYATCTSTLAGVVLNATFEMNSCHYTLGVLNVGPPYSSSLGIACSKEGDGVEMKAYPEGKKAGEGTPLCAYKASPQSGLNSVGLTNTGEFTERGVSAAFNLTTLAYERTVGTIPNCGAKTSSAATYKGTTKLTAAS